MKQWILTWYRRWLKSQASRRTDCLLADKVEPLRLQQTIAKNRSALGLVQEWLTPELVQGSVFRYGINPEIEAVLNLPLDKECTHADVLVYFCQRAPAPCRYLELGVSVGKTFWQVLHGTGPAECWGFDIEEINPVLKSRLTLVSREEWPGPANSLKKSPSSISRFTHEATGNTVTYICADIFDPRAWTHLAGQKFNVILSDALHTAAALEFEWSQMEALDIFHPSHAMIMWDDLNGDMHDWFLAKRPAIARRLAIAEDQAGTVYMNGWLGRREFPHRLGLAFRWLATSKANFSPS